MPNYCEYCGTELNKGIKFCGICGGKSHFKLFKKKKKAKDLVTHIVIVIDESGSMSSEKKEVEDSLEKFVKEQLEVEGYANLTIYTFSTVVNQVYDAAIDYYDGIEYKPSGGTALNDAIGYAIDGLITHCDEDKYYPDKVIVAIITDGAEWASNKYTTEAIKKKIEHVKEEMGWAVIFLGAGLSEEVVETMGTGYGFNLQTMDSGNDIGAMFASTSDDVKYYRSSTSASYNMGSSLAKKRNSNDDD